MVRDMRAQLKGLTSSVDGELCLLTDHLDELRDCVGCQHALFLEQLRFPTPHPSFSKHEWVHQLLTPDKTGIFMHHVLDLSWV